VANARLRAPHASLDELGKMIEPQLTKSGVNHRLRKLSSIADKLREK
jgi:putative sporulation transcription regulator whiA